ncbi:cyclic nucleotide-binding domain-containing protein [Desulfobacterales bacterium HSG2]|nr:cyclic nucleotide-binding domain-containing protein [Desulfobacterales bacterium HSG2]
MADKDMLSKFSFFSDVPQNKLSAIAEKCDLLEFKADDVVFKSDETAANVYGILDGEVELALVFKDKVLRTDIEYEESIRAWFETMEKPIVIGMVGPGEIFGWSSLVNPGRWTATARCSEPVRAFSLPAADFKSMMDQDPSLGYLIMGRLSEIISQRLQDRTKNLIEAWGQAFDTGKI